MRTGAREKVLRILADHQPVPLADDIIAQLDKVVEEAGA